MGTIFELSNLGQFIFDGVIAKQTVEPVDLRAVFFLKSVKNGTYQHQIDVYI